MPSVYTVPVDPNQPNNAHAYAVEMVGHAKEVLEFGCGHGHVTRVLQERGCEVVGLDHDPVALEDARRYAREVYHVDLNSTEFAEKLPLESFDVLLLGDVLEHLTDPVEILRAARPLLRRNGYIVASIPNVAHIDVRLALMNGRFEYQESGLLDRTHLRFFTLDSARTLMGEGGFTVVETRRVTRPAFHTEIGVDPGSVDQAVVERALEDSEAESYQFVMKAVKDSGDANVARLAQRVTALEDALHSAQIQRELAQSRLAAQRQADDDAVQEVAALKARNDELRSELDAMRGELDAMRGEIETLRGAAAAMESSKTFRYTMLPRRIYGYLLRLFRLR